MNALAFDTHQTVKRLISAGFDESQAEAVTEVMRDAVIVDLSHLLTDDQFRVALKDLATKADLKDFATKADLKDFVTKAEFRAEVEKLVTKAEFRAEIEKLATKAELWAEIEKLATKAELREVELRLENKIETVKSELQRWVFANTFGIAIINIAAVLGSVFMVARIMGH